MTLRKWFFISAVLTLLSGCGGPWSSGDRVLVSKCAYDNGFTSPNRYDVVVFKYPRGPMEKNTPKNYIKRLLGLPGELIAIFFGRLYHRVPEPGEAPFFDDLKDGKVHANDLWQEPHMHANDERSSKWFEEGKFTILRKPPHVLMALRRIVYDNDHQAKDLIGKLDRWSPTPNSSWQADNATGFVSDGQSADRFSWLRYQHLLRPDNERPHANMKKEKMLILDTLDYNTFQTEGEGNARFYDRIYSSAHWVGDLMLECNLEVLEAKGEFAFELSKGIYRFQARWDLATGVCSLVRIGPDSKEEVLASQPTRVKGPGSYQLRLANIDARLTVWVDRDLAFGDGKEYDPPEVRKLGEKISDAELIARRGPGDNDLEPASVGSKAARVKIAHLRLWRDIYYRTGTSTTDYSQAMSRSQWSNPGDWEQLHKQRHVTLYVQPGHYLCLGDNSQASSDSRDWGLVPERLMLGRALMVYFPIDRVGPIR